MTFYPYTVCRVFTTPESAEELVLGKTLELLLPPQRGQDLDIPGVGLRRVARVVQTARLAAPTWEPGYVAVALVRVELEAEDPAGIEAAKAAGWAPA